MDTGKEIQAGEPMDGAGSAARRRSLHLLAQATGAELDAAWSRIGSMPAIFPVRGPETGLIMVRGRMGGGGDPFNLGEATVTRATVRLATGEIGHGQMLGTDHARAQRAAVFDALWQRPDFRPLVDALLDDVASRIDAEDALQAEQTAATRVDFFTMVRGDD